MKLFKVGVWEENSGFIWVRAKDEESADEIAGELVSEHGVDRLFDHMSNLSEQLQEDMLNYFNASHERTDDCAGEIDFDDLCKIIAGRLEATPEEVEGSKHTHGERYVVCNAEEVKG